MTETQETPVSVPNLLHRAHQVVDAAFERAGCYGISRSQASILVAMAHLAQEDKAPPSQTQLVAVTGIDRSTMADVMRRLVKNGYVARRRSRADARRYVLTLTPEGRRAAIRCREIDGRLSAEFLRALPRGLDVQMVRGLKALIENGESVAIG